MTPAGLPIAYERTASPTRRRPGEARRCTGGRLGGGASRGRNGVAPSAGEVKSTLAHWRVRRSRLGIEPCSFAEHANGTRNTRGGRWRLVMASFVAQRCDKRPAVQLTLLTKRPFAAREGREPRGEGTRHRGAGQGCSRRPAGGRAPMSVCGYAHLWLLTATRRELQASWGARIGAYPVNPSYGPKAPTDSSPGSCGTPAVARRRTICPAAFGLVCGASSPSAAPRGPCPACPAGAGPKRLHRVRAAVVVRKSRGRMTRGCLAASRRARPTRRNRWWR